MSIAKRPTVNGHTVKRRKLSHDLDSTKDTLVRSSNAVFDETVVEDGSSDEDGSANDADQNGRNAHDHIASTNKPQYRHNDKSTRLVDSSTTSATTLQSQVQNFLAEIKPNHDAILRKMRSMTDELIGILKAIPHQPEMSFAQAQSFSQKSLRVTIPWSFRPAADIKYSFSFVPPVKVSLGGTLVQRLSTKGYRKVRIIPQMPEEMFQGKDYLNYRAIHKRSFYLACIASAVQKQARKDLQTNFRYLDDNRLIPVLEVAQIDVGKHNYIYEICPSFPDTVGPIERMMPAHNCLRKDELAQRDPAKAQDASPTYNGSLRWLASVPNRHEMVESARRKADHFVEACRLGTVWLRQRGFYTSKSGGGFGEEEWSMLCALLLESGGHQGRPLFSPRYSAVQLFKAILQVLSGRDMHEPFVLRGDVTLQAIGRPVLFDLSTGVNVLYKMTSWSYTRLKHHATASLTGVNSKKTNTFESTFATNVTEKSLEFDESYTIDLTTTTEADENLLGRLHRVLQQGLGDRVSMIDLQPKPNESWKITSSAPTVSVSSVEIGLLVHAETTSRFVDHGPPVGEKAEAESFRNFWGDKAELRRFKDGRIEESLVWSADMAVTHQIIHYLLAKHFRISSSSIESCHELPKSQLRSNLSPEDAFAAVNSKLQALTSALHHLEGLPLPVRSVSAASDIIRSSSLLLPLEAGSAQPIDMIIQFDTSGRWPDDLRAIQYTKIAFLTKIGDLLTTTDRTLECRIGLENSSTSSLGTHNTSYLDIIHPAPSPQLSPLIFRLRIYHDRDIHLIQSALSSKSQLSPPLHEHYQSALATQKKTLARISHTQAIRTLTTAFPPLSATTRLLKRFLSTHHLALDIPPEIAEILACNIFLNPAPWSTPGTPTTAFTRVLHFLSRWDWASTPLIVDLSLSQDMTLEQRQDLETRFAAWRKMDPNMNSVAWFVGTNIDQTGVVWTQGVAQQDPRPPRVVASRLTALASAAVQLIETVDEKGHQVMTKADWDSIFTSSPDDFDFVIRLKSSVVSGQKGAAGKGAKFKNLQLANVMEIDTTGIDTVCAYLEDLQYSFGSVAVFFYGGKHSGSNVIGGLWRPHVRPGASRAFKIRLGLSTVPYEVEGVDAEQGDESSCKANIHGMLAEMGVVGEDIIEKITSKAQT